MTPADRKPYVSDLTDAQWAIIEPLLPPVKSGTPRGGRPAVDRREIINAILYILTSGATWRHLPHDLPNWKTAHHVFLQWSRDGTWARVHDALRARLRQARSRDHHPSLAIIDSQSVKTTLKGGPRGATTRARKPRA